MKKKAETRSLPSPGQDLLAAVRAAFVAQGTTLHAWAVANDVKWPNARAALLGAWDGPKARELRARIITDAGMEKAA